jgi:hypothetical protein
MATDTETGTDISGDQILAVISGGFVGAILIGLLLQWGTGRDGIRTFGALVGRTDYSVSWTVLFVLSTLFAVLFVRFVSRSINSFVNQVITLSSRNELLQEILVPLLERSALTVTTSSLGLLYGFVVWLVFYAFLVPLWLSFVIGLDNIAIPNLGPSGFLAWILYGVLVGVLYGLIMES